MVPRMPASVQRPDDKQLRHQRVREADGGNNEEGVQFVLGGNSEEQGEQPDLGKEL